MSYSYRYKSVANRSYNFSSATPPSTPTIRVTSPVPDEVSVVDIWDPEVAAEDDFAADNNKQRPCSPKTYSFRYREDGQGDKEQSSNQEESNQQQLVNKEADSEFPASCEIEDAPLLAGLVRSFSDRSLSDNDDLRTTGESDYGESSEVDESSHTSFVTQIALDQKSDCRQQIINKKQDESSTTKSSNSIPDLVITPVASDGVRSSPTKIHRQSRRLKNCKSNRSMSLSYDNQLDVGKWVNKRTRRRRYSSHDATPAMATGAKSIAAPVVSRMQPIVDSETQSPGQAFAENENTAAHHHHGPVTELKRGKLTTDNY